MAKKSEETGVRKRKVTEPEVASELTPAPKARRSRATGEEPESEVKSVATKAGSSTAKAKSTAAKAKPRTTRPKTARKVKEPEETAIGVGAPFEDPIGDVSDGEAHTYLGDPQDEELQPEMAAYRADTAEDALEGTLESRSEPQSSSAAESAGDEDTLKSRVESGHESEAISPEKIRLAELDTEEVESTRESRPEAKLERLQKILSQAGIASRRHAEEMIEAGRVMVNGQVVTQLGTKADPTRDHIRVDGKLISHAERHRYFMLNKPRGYVTTVSDPEGRPTVMQFFSKMSERLYPVGRLDYDSEGLLLVTNDGELANQLTRAASGVEKTYLVKVAGRLTEDDLDQLRSGVPIERGAPGTEKVHTAPAEIRQIRQGDNPWYEVVLIEGRNRELRKMFQTVGHFVEKIRRVGYGPLVLDLEPGKLRELSSEEVSALRLAAEGKWKKKRPAQTGFRARGDQSRSTRTGFPSRGDRRGDKSRPPQRDFRPRSDRSGPPQTDFRPRGARGDRPDRAQTDRIRASDAGRPLSPRGPGSRMRDDARERGAESFGPRGTARRPERPFQQPSQGGRPFRESSGWKPREERSGAGARSQGRPFGAGTGQRPRGPNFEGAPRDKEKFAGKKFGEGRGRRFDEGQSERFSPRGGENRGGRPGRTWNRPDERRPTGAGSEQRFRGPVNREQGRRPAPEGREGSDNRGAERGPRGFTPGRSSKPGGQRSGFRGGPGGARRGGPRPGGGRNRG
jgi:23S rRNA pseudouridine2605 synthase